MISRQVPSGAALAGAPLEDRVKGHSDFFDRLVELIPAKYYVPDEQNPEWSKFNKSKSAKAAAKQAAKENSKKALRAKLNPVNAQSTLEKIRSKELGLSASAGRGRMARTRTTRKTSPTSRTTSPTKRKVDLRATTARRTSPLLR